MKIAVLSGKGGTGKTTVAVNLAVTMGWTYLDCDIEEPNGWTFLQPELLESEAVSMPFPVVDYSTCTHCGLCAKSCQFHALAVTDQAVTVFQALCHGCGLCSLLCPVGAISEQKRIIGRIDHGRGKNGDCWQGELNVGEPSGVRIINQLLRIPGVDDTVILDCAPGTSCNAVAATRNADFVLLVTEATPFGAHDLNLSIQLMQSMGLPGAIVVNRSTGEDELIEQLAREHSLPLVATLPFSRQAAAVSAAGGLLNIEGFPRLFAQLGQAILELCPCS